MSLKVASSNTSHLEAHVGSFRLHMKGIFDPYVLLPYDKKLISELLIHVRTRNYMVCKFGKISDKQSAIHILAYLVKQSFDLI